EGQIFIALPPDGWDWRSVCQDRVGAGGEDDVQRSAAVIPFRPLHKDGTSAPMHHAQQVAESTADLACEESGSRSFEAELCRMKTALGGGQLYLAASHAYRGDDRARIATLGALAHRCATPLVATGDVLYH